MIEYNVHSHMSEEIIIMIIITSITNTYNISAMRSS